MWAHLAGSTADWLMLSQGKAMLAVKGTRGGDGAPPSTYSMSAAAFGRVADVQLLRRSSMPPGKAPACSWAHVLSFTGPLH